MHALQPFSSGADHWTLSLLQFLLPYPSTAVASPGLPEFQGTSPSGMGDGFTDLCGPLGREGCAGCREEGYLGGQPGLTEVWESKGRGGVGMSH